MSEKFTDSDFEAAEDKATAIAEIPKKLRIYKPTVIRRPHISRIMNDAYTIIENEMRILMEQSSQQAGTGMDLATAKKFEILSRQMSVLAKEEREQNAADRMDDLSDEELISAMDEARKVLGS